MSNDINKALKRRDELLAEIADIDRLVSLYERYIGPVDRTQGSNDEGESIPDSTDLAPKPPRKPVVRRSGGPSRIARAAAAVLRKQGKPLQRGELVTLVEESGVEIPSEDKPKYLGTILWRRSDIFENIEGAGYTLKDADKEKGEGDPFTLTQEPDRPAKP